MSTPYDTDIEVSSQVSSNDVSTVTRHPLANSRCNSPDCFAHCSFVLCYVAKSVYYLSGLHGVPEGFEQ